MHAETKDTLRECIQAALDHAPDPPPTRMESGLVWRRNGGAFQGTVEAHTTLDYAWDRDIDWEALAAPLQTLLASYHPDHLGLVGTWTTGSFQCSGVELLRLAIGAIWSRHHSFKAPRTGVEAVCEDIESFVDSAAVPMKFMAPLNNFRHTGAGPIVLSSTLAIRRLTEDEVTQLYGGSLFTMNKAAGPFIHEWALAGQFDEKKILGELKDSTGDDGFGALRGTLDSCVLALRTFQQQPVGYDAIHFEPARFTPAARGRTVRTFGNEYIPWGNYELRKEDEPRFLQHHGYMRKGLHPALEIASSRLASASIRTNPADKLIDAVIGLEAVLLADGGGHPEYKGELRFRFAVNYAFLQTEPAARAAARRLARDLYDLRSKIAHGGRAEALERVGNEKLPLAAAAVKACELLQEVVSRFLPDSPTLPCTETEFWEKRYFGNEAAK